MRFQDDVKFVSDLTPEGSKLVRTVSEERRTVLLMDDSGAKAIMMDAASYDQWRQTVGLLRLVAQGEADIQADRLVSNEEAFDRAERAIEQACQKAGDSGS